MFVRSVVVTECVKVSEKMFQKVPPNQNVVVDQARGNINGEWRVVGPENREGTRERIKIAVIEGENDEFSARRLADRSRNFVDGNDFVMLFPDMVEQSIQSFGSDLEIAVGGEKGDLRGRYDAVQTEYCSNSRIHWSRKELEAS